MCFKHIAQIKAALGIGGISTRQSARSKRKDETVGTQIDLIIERKDNVVNMCEIKFYSQVFSVDAKYYDLLAERQALLEDVLSDVMAIHTTLADYERLEI